MHYDIIHSDIAHSTMAVMSTLMMERVNVRYLVGVTNRSCSLNSHLVNFGLNEKASYECCVAVHLSL
jgi:hypothetical protein